MSGVRDPDDRIFDWLQQELDTVGDPAGATSEAIREVRQTPQRHPRRSLRAWVGSLWGASPDRLPSAGPEVVLVPDSGLGLGSSASPTVGQPRQGAPLALAVAGVGAVAVLAAAIGLGWIGGPTQSLAPGEAQVRYGALPLEDPIAAGRDIVVATDGSGHFWTIADAVSEAVDGDRVAVLPGTYHETIRLTKDITLAGQGGPGAVVVRPDGRSSYSVPDGYSILSEFAPEGTEPLGADDLTEAWHYVLFLDGSDATVSGLSIQSGPVGSAVIIDGGAPLLRDVVIDPDGTQLGGHPAEPHEGVKVYGRSQATVVDSTITALISLREGSPVTMRDNRITGTCIIIADPGSDATIVGNRIESSVETGRCPRFNVAVLQGANPKIQSNTIIGDQRTDGIRVLGPDTAPTLDGNNVSGADTGIWIGGDAGGLVTRNNVTGARTGLRVIDAKPMVEVNGVYENDIGIAIEGSGISTFLDNDACRNKQNVLLSGGASIALELNPGICLDSSTREPESGEGGLDT